MEPIVWKEEYSVGVAEINEQHKVLFSILNDLINLAHNLTVRGELKDIFKRLVDYATFHFSTEEKYFEKFKYKDRKAHIKQHKFYIEKIEMYQAEYDVDENLMLSIDMVNFLKNWILRHVTGIDKMYTECFNDHGLY